MTPCDFVPPRNRSQETREGPELEVVLEKPMPPHPSAIYTPAAGAAGVAQSVRGWAEMLEDLPGLLMRWDRDG